MASSQSGHSNLKFWIIWLGASLVLGTSIAGAMVYGGSFRSFLLVGKTTHGHHQIELSCQTCHGSPFAGPAALQQACLTCHKAELKRANDSHPIKKFRDPRNADRLTLINATQCVSCHKEHKPGMTHAMGVTVPNDVCAYCHQKIYQERPTHKGYGFDTCTTAGCHNFHDNRALYENFLEKHADDPINKAEQYLALRARQRAAARENFAYTGKKPLSPGAANAPADKRQDAQVLQAWHKDIHAARGVNCMDCHKQKAAKQNASGQNASWLAKPGMAVCATCHSNQVRTFTEGKHGMRLRPGLKSELAGLWGLYQNRPLTPMKPEQALIPMTAGSHGKTLRCNSCHSAHDYNTRRAAVSACLGCHNDTHSRNYKSSAHYKTWQKVISGKVGPDTGVSCASCHMPVLEHEDDYGESSYFTTHNQNETLRPNEKMIRPACLNCHGLQFSLDALADKALILRNFAGKPSVHVKSIDWVRARARQRAQKRAGAAK